MTNADAIRGMTDEQLAAFLDAYVEPCFLCNYKEDGRCGDCEEGRLKWLKMREQKEVFE